MKRACAVLFFLIDCVLACAFLCLAVGYLFRRELERRLLGEGPSYFEEGVSRAFYRIRHRVRRRSFAWEEEQTEQ